MSNEILGKLLELAESNLNENEYIRVADLLKQAHTMLPNEKGIITFEKPFMVLYNDEDNCSMLLFKIYAYTIGGSENTLDTYHVFYNHCNKLFTYDELKDFIKYKLKTICVTDFMIDGWLGHEHISYKCFSNAYNECECECDDDCGRMEKHNEIITKYVDIIVVNFIKFRNERRKN